MEAAGCDAPRIRVAALMLLDGKVVTVRHRAGEHRYHLLPGGGVGYGETLAEALIREVREETGLTVAVGDPVLLSDSIDPSGGRHVVNIVFLAERVGGVVTERPEDPRVEAVDLLEPEDLRGCDLRPPVADRITALLSDPQGVGRAVYAGSAWVSDGREGHRQG